MNDHFRIVKVGEALEYLLEEDFSILFFKFASFSYIGQEVSSCTEFHDKADMLICLKGIKQPHYSLMCILLQDPNFKHDLFALFFFTFEKLFVYRFDCDKLLAQFVRSKDHFAKGS